MGMEKAITEPRFKATLAGPSPRFPFRMATYAGPCMTLWVSFCSSIPLPNQRETSLGKEQEPWFLGRFHFISWD